jgi:hypothetical protein
MKCTILKCVLFGIFAFTFTLFAEAQQDDEVVVLKDIGLLLPTTIHGDLKRGDREFGGGPLVHCKVTVSHSGRNIFASVWLREEETKDDYTTVDVTWGPFLVYTAKSDILTIDANSDVLDDGMSSMSYTTDEISSETNFRANDAGFQLFWPTNDVTAVLHKLSDACEIVAKYFPDPYVSKGANLEAKKYAFYAGIFEEANSGNQIYQMKPDSDLGPVKYFYIVADTGGDDVSDDDDPADDTRIETIKFKPITITRK